VKADYSPAGDDLQRISLVDGSIGSCSPRHCGPVKLTPEQAIERLVNWAEFETVEIPRLVAEIDAAIEPGDAGVGHASTSSLASVSARSESPASITAARFIRPA
jgi:hypothetical protein